MNLFELPTIKIVKYQRCKSKMDLFKHLFCQNLSFRERIHQFIDIDCEKAILKMIQSSITYSDNLTNSVAAIIFKNIKYNRVFAREFKTLFNINHYDVNLTLNNIDKHNKDVVFQRRHLYWVFKTAKENGTLKYMDYNISKRIVLETFYFKKFDPIISMNDHFRNYYKNTTKSTKEKVKMSFE